MSNQNQDEYLLDISESTSEMAVLPKSLMKKETCMFFIV